jgi:hypothetical protein
MSSNEGILQTDLGNTLHYPSRSPLPGKASKPNSDWSGHNVYDRTGDDSTDQIAALSPGHTRCEKHTAPYVGAAPSRKKHEREADYSAA